MPNEIQQLIPLCFHHYVFIRQETVADPEGARYADSVTRDVFFCDKCVEYRYVEVKRKRYGQY